MGTADDELDRRRELLDAWVDARRQIAKWEATAASLLSDRLRLHESEVEEQGFHRDAMRRSMIAEYSAAGHVPTTTMENAFADAFLLDAHPAVRESFARGTITAAHVREIVQAGAVVDQAVREQRADAETLTLFDIAALVVAESDTVARTRAHARRVAASLVGETVVERHRRAAGERSVTIRSVGDGLALLQVVLPEHLASAIYDRLSQLAHHVIDTRSCAEGEGDGERPESADARNCAERTAVFDDDPEPIFAQDLFPSDPALDTYDAFAGAIFGESDTFTLDPLPAGAAPAPARAGTALAAVPGGADSPAGGADSPAGDSSAAGSTGPVRRRDGDTRSIDQVRADLLADLLLAADPTSVAGTGAESIRGRIQVTIAATTLAGADDRPAELDGVGPIAPEIARDLAGHHTGWARLFLDHTGMVTATDGYTPTAAMRRLLRARDQHCRFPGCRMPVHRCQVDHNHDHAKGGPTRIDNLSSFCVGHHALKHPDIDARHRWTARQLPDGTVEWTSPLGRTYGDPPPRRVMFV
ncbi:HNH endonuclease signature motif containing protein [Microbacterium sp. XT11]|uniref:HNH endonuclease signature motif containing protein n=1 Tax=Microbacterium sp. XT11 TaxID=367477 RepID=UPI000742D85C|nr:HNH endonuclease signature motif containing protein [Microbacterium sp. XT11]ALX65809.1 hypothetical protein AB663_000528 [Microbacterium sp. XT11]